MKQELQQLKRAFIKVWQEEWQKSFKIIKDKPEKGLVNSVPRENRNNRLDNQKTIAPFFAKRAVEIFLFLLLFFFLGSGLGVVYSQEIKGYVASVLGSFEQDIDHLFDSLRPYLPFLPDYQKQEALPSESEPFLLGQPQKEPTKKLQEEYQPLTSFEEAIIRAVEKASPAVVSIIITKDLPVLERYYENPFEEFFGPDSPFDFKIPRYRQKGTQKQEVGGGTGFIVSSDGLILTNKHVVSDLKAEYTVFTNDGKRYDAKVLARDPFQDLAILKISPDKEIDKKGNFKEFKFPVIELGDSDTLKIGQTVIAIGNALGEFRNTVSVGVISGLGRTITASGNGMSELLEDVIQTDAAINRGNSGGPLLNSKGQVIGVNVAMAQAAQNIGFAIPINKAKRAIRQVMKNGKIVYPFLGVLIKPVTPQVQKELGLGVDYGALIVEAADGSPGVVPGSVADKAGLKTGDVILEVDGKKIDLQNSLPKIIRSYEPGDQIVLKVWRDGKLMIIRVVLGEKTSEE